MEWQPMSTAPTNQTVLVADFAVHTIAVAHECNGWRLGRYDASYIEELDFEPRWWLPASYKGNPYSAPLPIAQNQPEQSQ